MVTATQATPEQRRARGRAAREVVPRSAQARWDRPADAPAAITHLRAQERIRVKDLLPLRYERMAASPWTYFRGAAAVMAADLASRPHTGLTVQMCGDAHVLNFGLWATPERNLAFALRDFDETLPGPFEWDVKRLATSLVIVARENGHPDQVGLDAVACVRAGLPGADAPLRQNRPARHLVRRDPRRRAARPTSTATPAASRVGSSPRRRRTAATRALSTGSPTPSTDSIRIRENPPVLTHVDDPRRFEIVHEVFDRYRDSLQDDRKVCLDRFTYTDAARQVVGVGSVGMLVHLVLLTGPRDEPLFLQVKQAGPSVYEKHLGRSQYANHAARVINGKRLIQSATDMFAGWTSYQRAHFYVRQFRDMKVIPDTHLIKDVLASFARACGEALAKAHARSGDPEAIDAYLGRNDTFTEAMQRFARTYADRNEADHADLGAAVAGGKTIRPA